MDTWDLSGQRAAASRERAAALHELLARFAAWRRGTPTIGAPQVRGRECSGTAY
jgi:hypothetical protein